MLEVLAPIFGVFGAAVITWLMNLSVQRRSRSQAEEIERLKSSLASITAREVSTHESGLRERAEFRLKLYATSLESIGQVSRSLAALFDYFAKLAAAVKTGTPMPPDEGLFAATLAVGLFLPPSLDVPFNEVLEAVGKFAEAITQARGAEPDMQRAVISVNMKKSFGPALEKFTLAAKEWKKSIWIEGGP
jgi:hypothetical protein